MVDPKMARIGLDQASDLLEDFPPEVLLQKPDVIKVCNLLRSLFFLTHVHVQLNALPASLHLGPLFPPLAPTLPPSP